MKKYKAIIFDLDGVICHTDQYHYLAWKKLADENDLYFDQLINNKLRGVSRMESLEIILETNNRVLSMKEKEQWATKKNAMYVEYLNEMSEKDLLEEERMTLLELKKRGYRLAIGSSSKNAKLILDKLGCMDLFEAISDGTNITNSKPDPEVFVKGAEFLNLESKDCLVVEDAKAGIDAAVNGGFCSAGLGTAAEYNKTLYKLSSFGDLLNIL